jgi:outer membrane receptor protein involved in Fe transport
LTTRQRQNLGRTVAQGVELEARLAASSKIFLAGGYQFADSHVDQFAANPALEGRLLPQVPRHQFTVDFSYVDPRRFSFAAQGRFLGIQFEDDLNQLPLERFFNLDLSIARPLRPGVEVFVAAENVLNSRYAIGRTPVRTLAAPVFARVGLRWTLGETTPPVP